MECVGRCSDSWMKVTSGQLQGSATGHRGLVVAINVLSLDVAVIGTHFFPSRFNVLFKEALIYRSYILLLFHWILELFICRTRWGHFSVMPRGLLNDEVRGFIRQLFIFMNCTTCIAA